MNHFVDDPAAIVTQALDGLVAASDGTLARLDGYPDIKVVVRTDWTADRVAVISGGGAGHEPTHAGFVGQGMLAAAISGEIFASPSVDAVLAAILAVTGDAGCLLVVKNYTGDRLNFGLAMERARAVGKSVEMVIVGDDVALPDSVRPRGIAGTLFVHKIAGAAAERGEPLAAVTAQAQAAAVAVRSIGVSLTGASVPGRTSESRIAEGEAELGLGIHGEPGIEIIAVDQAHSIVERMARDLSARLPADGPVALLINNLGGVAALEMGVVLRDVLETPLGRRCELMVGPSALMTAMDMRGFSISALPIDDATAAALTAPVGRAAGWPATRRVGPVATRPVPALPDVVRSAPSANASVRRLVEASCGALIAAEDHLNELDSKVGDGDTGSTFATAARRLLSSIDSLALDETALLFGQLSSLLSTSMGGSSGVLGSIFFEAAGTATAAGSPLPDALRRGLDSMQALGGAAPGDRTMIDALDPAITAMQQGLSVAAVADQARKGAAATAEIATARAGRASYVAARHLVDVEDSGAAAVSVIFGAIEQASAR